MADNKAMVTAHVAVFFMGMAGVLGGASGFEPWRSTSYRVTFGGLLLGAIIFVRKRHAMPPLKKSAGYLALGTLLAIHWFAFFKSIDILGVMLGSALIGLEPLIIALFAAVFLRERLPLRYIIALMISLVGFVGLGIQGAPGHANLWQGCAWAIFAFAVFAIFVLSNRVWVQSAPPLVISGREMIGAIPLSVVMTPGPWLPQGAASWAFALGLGILCTGLAYVLYNTSMRVLSASIAGVLLSLEVVYGILGGWIIGDRMSLITLGSVALISNLLMIDLYIYMRQRRRQRAACLSPQPPE